MYGVNILVDEHDRILQFIDLVRTACLDVIEGGEPDIQMF